MAGRPVSVCAAALALAASGLLGACAVERAPEVGQHAPGYAASTLDGGTVRLSDLHGEVVLLNLWATWCFPCRREMPSLEALHREHREHGLRIVAVSVDAAGATREIRAFLDELGISFLTLHDPDQRVARAFRTRGLPETFLIGRDGRILRH
ncbi:MAG TPA: TlpA disulfide reductase family protein, partial [Gammaproteobacteria bacterium]|nr:TlpA disulfide reductase family protein [Gammaproteobacteria bacterium]